MAVTREFRKTVLERAENDPEFRLGLLTEALDCFLEGDVDAGKILLRDYINATLGFVRLAELTGKKPASLHRMFGPSGNPTAENLFSIVALLQKHEGVSLGVEQRKRKAS